MNIKTAPDETMTSASALPPPSSLADIGVRRRRTFTSGNKPGDLTARLSGGAPAPAPAAMPIPMPIVVAAMPAPHAETPEPATAAPHTEPAPTAPLLTIVPQPTPSEVAEVVAEALPPTLDEPAPIAEPEPEMMALPEVAAEEAALTPVDAAPTDALAASDTAAEPPAPVPLAPRQDEAAAGVPAVIATPELEPISHSESGTQVPSAELMAIGSAEAAVEIEAAIAAPAQDEPAPGVAVLAEPEATAVPQETMAAPAPVPDEPVPDEPGPDEPVAEPAAVADLEPASVPEETMATPAPAHDEPAMEAVAAAVPDPVVLEATMPEATMAAPAPVADEAVADEPAPNEPAPVEPAPVEAAPDAIAVAEPETAAVADAIATAPAAAAEEPVVEAASDPEPAAPPVATPALTIVPPAPAPIFVQPAREVKPRVPDDIVGYWHSLRRGGSVPDLKLLDQSIVTDKWHNSLLLAFGPQHAMAAPEPGAAKIKRLGQITNDVEYTPMVIDSILSLGQRAVDYKTPLDEVLSFPLSSGMTRCRLVLLPLCGPSGKIDHVLCQLSRATNGTRLERRG